VKLLPRPKAPIRTDDNIGRGMDFALVTLLFLGIGYGLDRLFGTRPILMIVFVTLALVGNFARMWVEYERSMTRLEAERARSRSGRQR
jgi:ATP synthase protein I